MRLVFVCVFVSFVGVANLMAQCPSSAIESPLTVCIDQLFDVSRTSVQPGEISDWDLCAGDLIAPATAQEITTLTNISAPRGIVTVNSIDGIFSFIIGENNRFIRMHFASGLESAPSITNFQNIGNLLATPRGITHVLENESHYFIIANQAGSLVLVNFGNDLLGTPQVSLIPSLPSLSGVTNLEFLKFGDANLLYVIGVGTGNRQIVVLDFGTSILNTPQSSIINFPTASGLSSLSLIQDCDQWYGLLSSNVNNRYYKLHFGEDPRTLNSLEEFTDIAAPLAAELRWESGNFYGFISANTGNLIRLNFGSNFNTPGKISLTDLGDFSLLAQPRAFEIINNGTLYYALAVGYSDRKVTLVKFTNNCANEQPIVMNSNKFLATLTSAGAYNIEVTTRKDAFVKRSTATLIVSPTAAPTINFNSQNVCEDAPVNFTSTTSLPITSYDWNFDDGNTSEDPNPSNIFLNDGQYNVRLVVTADNGCQNLVEDTVSIFNQPIAGFEFLSLPQYCTNQQYGFQNISIIDPDYPVTWQWQINSANISADENLSYTFTTTASHEVKLIASIPGCSSETSQMINSLSEGPIPDFTFTGQCEDAPVTFTNETTGAVNGYNWDFGDGQNSTNEDPLNSYGSPGTFNVTLIAFGSSGCNNTRTKSVTIYSKPLTNFSVALPPFSCSGTPTQFTDTTPNPFDSNLASWQWNFGDGTGSSTTRNPQYTFQNAGDYSVSLTATTNFGCSTTIQKPVTISPSPVANFTNSPPCLGVPVNFTNASTGSLQSQQWQIQSSFYTVANPVHAFLTSGDKNVTLNVTATNGCIASVSRTLNVPTVLTPDFSVSRNCINQQTEFTDVTNDAADPVVGYAWNFAGLGNGTENPQVFSFANTGSFNVSLSVTTQTGCVHSAAKNVSIINSPQANFIATPSFGPPPLQVQFTNTSTNATNYLWEFNDPNTSSSTSVGPSFTFSELGSYEVDLTAFNAQGCSNLFSRLIEVVIPFTDVALTQLELIETGQASVKPAVTIQNKGNIAITNLPLAFEVDGTVFRTFVTTSIPPNSSYYHLSDFELPASSSLSYVCVVAEIEDVSPDDNQLCASVNPPVVVLAPYPNPVARQADIEVQWIVRENRPVEVFLINSIGQTVYAERVNSVSGLNTFRLSATGFQAGLYFVQVRSGDFSRTHRLMVQE